MKQLAIFLGTTLSLASLNEAAASQFIIPVHSHHSHHHSSSSSSSSSSSGITWRVGDFALVAFTTDQKVVLGNNRVYEGVGNEAKAVMANWLLHDVIRVLGTEHRKTFLLINLATGETVRTHVQDEV